MVDTILLLDVIEHLEDPKVLIREAVGNLPNLKSIMITVPAGQALWNNFDEFNGHYLRYDRPQLVNLMKELGWQPSYCGYFFHALYWPALLFAKLGLKRSVTIPAPKGAMAGWHRLLSQLFFWEYKVMPGSLVGSSIIGIFHRA
jgi:hypothetical protein